MPAELTPDAATSSFAELVHAWIVQRERRAQIMPDLYAPPTYPNPGATEDELAAVEARIGRRLDPHFRQLLSVADGWAEFDGSRTLLGTRDIGRSSQWAGAVDMVETYATSDVEPPFGWPADTADAFPICEYYSNMAFVVLTDGSDHRQGQVRDFSSGSNEVFHSVATWFAYELQSETDYLDGESFGPHGHAWRRALTATDPSIAEIVAKLVELRHAIAPIRPGWMEDPGPDPRAGATPESLDRLERDCGITLSAEHRALLLITDGWPAITRGSDLLSVADLSDGNRWQQAVRQTAEWSTLHPRYGYDGTMPSDAAPFVIASNPNMQWGIGIRPTGEFIDPFEKRRGHKITGVRDYLLDVVDSYYNQLQMAQIDRLDTDHIPR